VTTVNSNQIALNEAPFLIKYILNEKMGLKNERSHWEQAKKNDNNQINSLSLFFLCSLPPEGLGLGLEGLLLEGLGLEASTVLVPFADLFGQKL